MDQVLPSLIRQQCLIDGRWAGEPKTPVYNPATGVAIAQVPNLGAAETRAAIEAADRALPAWSGLLAKERSAILRRWYELQLRHAESGLGREGSRHGLEEFREMKYMFLGGLTV